MVFQKKMFLKTIELKSLMIYQKKKMNEMIFTIKRLTKTNYQKKDFISNIIDNSNVIVAVIDSCGRMFKINKFGQEFIGYKQEEISNKPFFGLNFYIKI